MCFDSHLYSYGNHTEISTRVPLLHFILLFITEWGPPRSVRLIRVEKQRQASDSIVSLGWLKVSYTLERTCAECVWYQSPVVTWNNLRTLKSAMRCYCTCVSARTNNNLKKRQTKSMHIPCRQVLGHHSSLRDCYHPFGGFFFWCCFIFVALKRLTSVRVRKLFHSLERPPLPLDSKVYQRGQSSRISLLIRLSLPLIHVTARCSVAG